MIIIFLILFTIISSFYIPGSKNISLILICFWGIFWGVSGKNLQEKFQTYARRKFIKGYYNTDALLRTISEQLSLEKNREEIFKVLEHELDEAIQLEKIGFIIALRDKDGHLASYAYYEKISLESTEYNIVNLKLNHPLIANLAKRDNLVELRDLDIANQKMVINQLGFNKNTFFMSFTSPEMLEGILVLGERSGGIAYSLRDLDFLKLIINTVNSLLYRLTPYEELEKSFTENKQKLHNAELAILQAKKEEADCANAYKSLFLAQMTHDLRTPLYVVIGVLDMLTRAEKVRQDGLGLQKPLDLALVSAQRQLNLVNTILDLSKIESGKMEVHIESFALNDLCEGLLEQMQTLLKEKTVKFIIENNLLAEDLIIKADKTSLQQVITNLLSNAAKFTTEGEIRLRITKEEGKLYFEVRDTGIGLSQENINRLFTSYTQIENELQKKYKGTGLGLSICKGLVEAHKGEIVVESEEGKGTAFIFWIPYLVGKRQEKPDAEAVKESMAKILAKIKNKTILMVDDDEFNLAYAQMILEGKINYDLASGGKDAIIKAKQKKYDVVFLDLNMPEMDGKGAYNEIRAFDKITPIIALTAAAMKGTKEELEQFGFSGYLSKPFKEDDLLGFIYLKVG
jgi:signal transduction histidine kinase